LVYRKGRVTFCVQEDSRSAPLLLLEFAMPTQSLVREMSTGLLRIALECEKSNKNACKDLKAGGLFAEPVWTMFCNGRKVGGSGTGVVIRIDLGVFYFFWLCSKSRILCNMCHDLVSQVAISVCTCPTINVTYCTL
jgi:hypothetical protein